MYLVHKSAYNYNYIPAKLGIKPGECAGGCVSFVHECSYLAVIAYDQTHVISIGNAGW